MEIHSEILSEFSFKIFLEINLDIFETSLETKLETWLSMVVITKLLVWFYLIQFDSESFSLRKVLRMRILNWFLWCPGLEYLNYLKYQNRIKIVSGLRNDKTKKLFNQTKKLGKVKLAKKVLFQNDEMNRIGPIATFYERFRSKVRPGIRGLRRTATDFFDFDDRKLNFETEEIFSNV